MLLSPVQVKKAVAYNLAWDMKGIRNRLLLPDPLDLLDPGTLEFAEAVAARQAELRLTVDGQLGPITWEALLAKSWPTGIDVSGHNADVDDPGDDLADMRQIKAAGHDFLVVKASQHERYAYKALPRLRLAAEQTQLYTGTYHYANPTTRLGDAEEEARWYFAQAGLWRPGQLPPALDSEDPKTTLKGSKLVDWTGVFLETADRLFGCRLMVYTGRWYWQGWYRKTTAFNDRLLWIASYPTKPPGPEASFPRLGTWEATIWQWSSKHTIPGLKGLFDTNRFNGTRSDLDALCGR